MNGADIEGGVLRVKALQNTRRRAGLAFTKEPTDVAFTDLGEGAAALIALAAILADPLLKATLVVDGEEREITDEEREQLLAIVNADRSRVDPTKPPTADAAEAAAAASDEAEKAEPEAAASDEAEKAKPEAAAKAEAEPVKPEAAAKAEAEPVKPGKAKKA